MHNLLTTLTLLSAPFLALAKTDYDGCTSSAAGNRIIYYVPGTGEICEALDCGGGRAPPKTTVPGCNLYKGTATYSPSYLPGFGPNAAPTAAPAGASAAPLAAAPPPAVTSAPSASSVAAVAASQASSAQSHASSVVSAASSSAASVSSSVRAAVSSAPSSVAPAVVTGRTNGTTSAVPRVSAFAGEAVARNAGAGLGLLGFLGAVVALL